MMLFREIREDSKTRTGDAEVFSAVVNACHLGGRDDRALKLYDEMEEKGLPPTSTAFKAALRACEALRLSKRRQGMFDRARQQGIRLDAELYNSAISASAREQQQQFALALFDEMNSYGFSPNRDAYRLALDRAVRKHTWDALDALYPAALGQCLSTAKAKADGGQDGEDTTAGTSLIQDENAGTYAEQLIREMQEYDVRADARAFSMAIEACALSGESELASELLEEGRRSLRQTLPQAAFTAVMQAYASDESWEAALGLLASMRKDSLEPSAEAMKAAMDCCGAGGHSVSRGAGVPVGADSAEYAAVMSACIQTKDYARALEIFDEADEESDKGVRDENVLRAAIRAAELSGASERARVRDLRGRLRYLLTGDEIMLERESKKPKDRSLVGRYRRGEFRRAKRDRDSAPERGGQVERILF